MPIDCTVVTKLILLVVRAFAAITSLSPIPSTQTGTNDWTWISFEIRIKRQRTKLLLVSCVVVDDDDRAVHCFYRSFMHPLLIVRSFDLHACYSMHSSISSLIQWVIRFDCHPTCPFIHLFTDHLFTNNCLLICRLTRRDHHHSSVHQHRSLIEINSHHLKQLLWSSDFRTRFNSLTVDDGEHNDNDE